MELLVFRLLGKIKAKTKDFLRRKNPFLHRWKRNQFKEMMKIFNKENQFYPTPQPLIEKLLEDIDFRSRNYHKVLEPSAGKADIADYMSQQSKFVNVDCIEINPELTHILKGKGYKVIHDDFLTFNTYKSYNLIVGNPPFNMGSFHANHAISLMERRGGKIRFILNAETIRNPYSNSRKLLARKIEQYNGEVEFVANGFSDAEHKTDVEVAIVRIDIPEQKKPSNILENLRAEQIKEVKERLINNDIITSNPMEAIVLRYELEIKTGVKLIEEYEAFRRVNLKSFDDEHGSSILSLKITHEQDNQDSIDELINKFIENTRKKYWSELFQSNEFAKLFTSESRYDYYDQIDELRNYDFTEYNILQMKCDISQKMCQSIDEIIMKLFEEFTKYHMHEFSSNIWLYSGWKTNKCSKINEKKVIIPMYAFDKYNGEFDPRRTPIEKLTDITKVLLYLSGEDVKKIDEVREIMMDAYKSNRSKNIELPFFTITCYKKGTCHITWNDENLIKKFNLFAARNMNNLPPSYGKKTYNEMNDEEKAIVDSYEGEESYNDVMANKSYYIQDNSKLLMLGGGQ